jgi:hypothetical protein
MHRLAKLGLAASLLASSVSAQQVVGNACGWTQSLISFQQPGNRISMLIYDPTLSEIFASPDPMSRYFFLYLGIGTVSQPAPTPLPMIVQGCIPGFGFQEVFVLPLAPGSLIFEVADDIAFLQLPPLPSPSVQPFRIAVQPFFSLTLPGGDEFAFPALTETYLMDLQPNP